MRKSDFGGVGGLVLISPRHGLDLTLQYGSLISKDGDFEAGGCRKRLENNMFYDVLGFTRKEKQLESAFQWNQGRLFYVCHIKECKKAHCPTTFTIARGCWFDGAI